MTDLFGFLILASLIALVVGLVKPTAFSRFIKNPTRKKVGLMLGGLFIIFFIGFGMTTDTKTTTNTPSEPTQQTKTAKNDPTSAPQAPVLSEQDQIKAFVADQLKGTNNMKRDNLKKVELLEGEGGGWNITVEFNASDNLSTNLRKKVSKRKCQKFTPRYIKAAKTLKPLL